MKSWIVLLLVANLAPAAKAQSCTLCANGASPIDSTLVINNEGLTCGGYDANVRLTNSTDSECAEIQKSGILLKCCAPPAGNCKMCPNGDSGFMKDMAVDGSTCGDLALTASTYLSSSTECADYQRIGVSCGCTASTGSCTLCPNGSDNFNPDAISGVENGQSITCTQFEAYAGTWPSSSTECANAQITGVQKCGCTPAAGSCELCGNGDPVSNPDKPITDTAALGNTTCGAFATYLSAYAREDPVCNNDEVRLKALDCGCAAPSGSCTLCEDGSAPTLLDSPADSANKTCRQYEQFAKLVTESDPRCSEFRNTGIRKCDCEVPAGRCSMCGNGSYDATKTIGGTNCRDYDLYLKTLTATSAVCQQTDETFGYRCGCPIPAGNCYFCPDRAAPPNPSQVVGTNGETCGQFARSARFVKRGTAACSNYHITAVALCGCRPRSNTCRLCSDRSDPPNPNLEVGDSTCGAQAAYYSALPVTSPRCTSEAKITTSILCGCDPPEGSCSLCPDGSDTPNPNSTVNANGLTCARYEQLASTIQSTNSTCATYQSVGVSKCGCDPPVGSCSICSDGSDPPSLSQLIGNVTCGEYAAYVSSFSESSSECASSKVRTNGILCGCPAPPNSCSLCKDGSNSPTPDATVSNDGRTCSDFATSAKTVAKGTSDCSNYEQFGIQRCGCPTDENNCEFCKYGIGNFDASKALGNTTCGELATYVSSLLKTDSACSTYDTNAVSCGCTPSPNACLVCPPGSGPAVPDQVINDQGLTCAAFETDINTYMNSDSECPDLITQFTSFCECN